MTREDEIRARLENATGAPWAWDTLDDSEWPVRLNADASSFGYVLEACTPADDNPYDLPAIDITNGDAEFIANAPSDVDYLLKENQRLRDANNTMAAYLQSLANPDAWNGRTYVRGFREPWVYADDALRYAGIEEREPRRTPDGAE